MADMNEGLQSWQLKSNHNRMLEFQSAPDAAAGPVELAFFGFAAWGLYKIGATSWSLLLAGLVVVHYALSWDRIAWLLGLR